MANNQFFYLSKKKSEDGVEITEEGSFNLDKIVRTMKTPEGVVILMDDGHEESFVYNTLGKGGKIEEQRKRQWVVSEILLTEEVDIARFKEYFR